MYTDDFKQRINDLYPEDDEINRLAREGKWELGRALRLASNGEITHKDIIAAQSLEELQAAAIKLRLRKELYDEFMVGKGSIPSQQQAHLILDSENRIISQEETDREELSMLGRIRRRRNHESS